VVGLMNVQFAIQNGTIYVLEVNPRASRTVPFVSKATGLALAKIAARCMTGASLATQDSVREVVPPYYSVKEAVFPFIKFPGADTILGPEMKSTGEVMGVGTTFGEAFVKSQLAAGDRLPESGKVFISVRDADKPAAVAIAHDLVALGFQLVATRGRPRGAADQQGGRRSAARRRHDQEWRRRADSEYRRGIAHRRARLLRDPPRGAAGAHYAIHDVGRRARRVHGYATIAGDDGLRCAGIAPPYRRGRRRSRSVTGPTLYG
jgi:carbamoyl-phosphate synthase L subunit-like protein